MEWIDLAPQIYTTRPPPCNDANEYMPAYLQGGPKNWAFLLQ